MEQFEPGDETMAFSTAVCRAHDMATELSGDTDLDLDIHRLAVLGLAAWFALSPDRRNALLADAGFTVDPEDVEELAASALRVSVEIVQGADEEWPFFGM